MAHDTRTGPIDRPLRPDGLPQPRTPFEQVVVDVLADLFEAYPTWGTSIGYHAVDDRWPLLGPGGREVRISMLRRHLDALAGLADGSLTADERIDRDLLPRHLERLLFGEEVLREEAWDPLSLVTLLGGGLFGILAREYAPWDVRGGVFLARLRALPQVTRDGAAALTGLPGRPVSLLHLDTAIRQLAGIEDLIDEGLAEAHRRAEDGEGLTLVAPLEGAGAAARQALADLRVALDTDVRARAEGEGRLGAELFRAKLRHALSDDLAPEELRRRAWADHAAVRSEMVRLARSLWPTWAGDEALPEVGDVGQESRVVRRVLDAIAAEHQQPDALIDHCREEVLRIEAFCREHEVVGLTDEPMAITWTPRFMRAYGRAFLDSPGPLDRGQRSHFWITPPDPADGPEAAESYLREENDRMLRVLCIHEGIPGHYLQLAWSNRCPSLVRSVFIDGMFAEGWAVYVTQVMMDLGYAAGDEALLLTHWKMYLRACTNAILDVEVHTGALTEEAAMDLMVRGAFQEVDEARGKWLRARLTSTQLSTYFVGSQWMWDLEVEARRRAAVSAGASADDVPPQRPVGGLGVTPGFDYRAHLESVISHGSPPIPWLRRILLG